MFIRHLDGDVTQAVEYTVECTELERDSQPK